MPEVIAIGNSKGGVGKTTVTLALTDYLTKKLGKKVFVIDADNNQHSIEEFHQAGLIDFDFTTVDSVARYNALNDVFDLKKYDYILIDTAPHSHTENLFDEILSDAEIVLTVIKPSPKDFLAFNKIMSSVLKHSKAKNQDQKQYLLINEVKHMMSNVQKESIEAIESENNVQVLKSTLGQRTYFESLGLEKRTDRKAELEIEALSKELLGI